MTSDEGMMHAARVMRDAAETNQRTASRIEEAVGQMQIIFDASYGGTAPRLLEELEKASASVSIPGGEPGYAPRECSAIIAMVRNFPSHVGNYDADLPEKECGENRYEEQCAFRHGWSMAVNAINDKISQMQNSAQTSGEQQ
jgi:hypothetical protein